LGVGIYTPFFLCKAGKKTYGKCLYSHHTAYTFNALLCSLCPPEAKKMSTVFAPRDRHIVWTTQLYLWSWPVEDVGRHHISIRYQLMKSLILR
jgi:hypothetical protein